MKFIYSTHAQEDYEYWTRHNPKIAQKIDLLIADIQLHPYQGIGKSELLRFKHSGYWSRRINHEYRLVYKIADRCLFIVQCRYHYKK